MTILLSTHYMREAETLCDEVVFLRGADPGPGDPATLKREILLGDRIELAVEGDAWAASPACPASWLHGDGGRVDASWTTRGSGCRSSSATWTSMGRGERRDRGRADPRIRLHRAGAISRWQYPPRPPDGPSRAFEASS